MAIEKILSQHFSTQPSEVNSSVISQDDLALVLAARRGLELQKQLEKLPKRKNIDRKLLDLEITI